MRPVQISILWVATLFFTYAAANDLTVPDYPVQKVTENVYMIEGPLGMPSPDNRGFMNNPAFIVGNNGIVVIDPGSSIQVGEMTLRAVRSISDKPVIAVFNTHIHGDHWLGNQAIADAYPSVKIYGHPRMFELIDAGEGQVWVELMSSLTAGATNGTTVVGPNSKTGQGDEHVIDGLTFRIYHFGPAHTDSDIMIEAVDSKTVFLGDNVTYNRIPRMNDGSFTGNIESVTKVIEHGAEHYVPGHGPAGDVEVPTAYRDYLATLYAKVKELYDEGLSDFEMKDQVNAALTPYHDWSGYEEELGKHISLAYLQIEQADF